MNEFKGTKTTWVVSGENKTFVYALNEKGTNSFSLNINNDGKTTIEEQQANALLISKAPEILEKLNEIVEAIENETIIIKENIDNDGYENLGGRFYQEAKQLIKSATELS